MKIVSSILIASVAVIGVLSVGCGDNPCQDAIDAVTAAEMRDGCGGDVLTGYMAGLDPDNCNQTDADAQITLAQVKCFDDLKACDTTGMISLQMCLSAAMQ
jgi:hypothetical protein